jgi:hypothetical protein
MNRTENIYLQKYLAIFTSDNPDKPKSKGQKHITTEKGKALLKKE